jgi:hypothetical protein
MRPIAGSGVVQADRKAGDTYGHGLLYFDALWYAVSPMGNAVTANR